MCKQTIKAVLRQFAPSVLLCAALPWCVGWANWEITDPVAEDYVTSGTTLTCQGTGWDSTGYTVRLRDASKSPGEDPTAEYTGTTDSSGNWSKDVTVLELERVTGEEEEDDPMMRITVYSGATYGDHVNVYVQDE